MLQVGVGRLEAVEAVPLGEGGHSEAVRGPRWGVDLGLERAEHSEGPQKQGPGAGTLLPGERETGRQRGWEGAELGAQPPPEPQGSPGL